jgi:arylsulfatase
VDVFRTLTTLAGAPLPAAAEAQVEGRDLTPLLANPHAPWPERTLVTHVGRWPKGAAPGTAKYRNAAIRDSRYTLVSMEGGSTPAWELYDVLSDPGQQTNLAAITPAEVQRLSTAYDAWWTSILPGLVNEYATPPAMNPFKERYWKQFGETPSAEDLGKMDPKN